MEPIGAPQRCVGIVTRCWRTRAAAFLGDPKPAALRYSSCCQMRTLKYISFLAQKPELHSDFFLCVTWSFCVQKTRLRIPISQILVKLVFFSWQESLQLLPRNSLLLWLGTAGWVNRGPISWGLLQSWFVNAWEYPCWILIVCGSRHMISSVWSQQCSFSALLIFDGCCAWLHWCGSRHSRQWFPIRCFVSTTEVWSPYMMANIY